MEMTMSSKSNFNNIGSYIKSEIIPKGMTVTEASRFVGVGRPALSNLLNGKSTLSNEMALRLEKAFGVDAVALMEMQTSIEVEKQRLSSAAIAVKSHVAPFLQIKGHEIEEWSSRINSRSRLPVLLRILVNSTCDGLTKVDFPGNDHAERHGNDGTIIATQATPWIPLGNSIWEFGVNKIQKSKADNDYNNRTLKIPKTERDATTFVFVTPTKWDGKEIWAKSKREENQWKNVIVYDASDIEQWLEQSVAAQSWFACEIEKPSEGVKSLEQVWKEWQVDCPDKLTEELFSTPIEQFKGNLDAYLASPPTKPFYIVGDSKEESLAFLYCYFSKLTKDEIYKKDKVVVFTEGGTLGRLISSNSDFIPVLTEGKLQIELAQYATKIHSIIVETKNAILREPDITLETLGGEAFSKPLEKVGLHRDEVSRLEAESGRSLTVLRRRLSNLDAIKTPKWITLLDHPSEFVPILFAGAWSTNKTADIGIIELLCDIDAGASNYQKVELMMSEYLDVADPPFWSAGSYRGVISKIDALFALNHAISKRHLERFFEIAHLVLSEDDPSLDLPPEQRMFASIHGKVREISSALRDSISETIVLLSVYGNSFFFKRTGFDCETAASNLVIKLLSPLTTRKLIAHQSDLPLYAEASPNTFLKILEADLEKNEPEVFGVLVPVVSSSFARCDRSGLLWALEGLAWNPKNLSKVVRILAQMSGRTIDDNYMNKPSASLSAIFRYWMPQTAANLDERKALLSMLAASFPEIAWNICVEQFSDRLGFGSYSHKPKWRNDGYGLGGPVSVQERIEFSRFAFDLTLAWNDFNIEKLCDLIGVLPTVPFDDQSQILDKVSNWAKTASDQEKSLLKEKIRTSTFTRRAIKKRTKSDPKNYNIKKVCEVYDEITPTDLVWRHQWLFIKNHVEESYDDLLEEEFDFRAQVKRIEELRKNAIKEIYMSYGVEGVLRLSLGGEASFIIGWLLSKLFKSHADIQKIVAEVFSSLKTSQISNTSSLLRGIFNGLENSLLEVILRELAKEFAKDDFKRMSLYFPFNKTSWSIISQQGMEISEWYWQNVDPEWSWGDTDHLTYVVDNLLRAHRPRAAIKFSHLRFENIDPDTVLKMLEACTQESSDMEGAYLLNPSDFKNGIKILTESGKVDTGKLATLEWLFLEAYQYDETPQNLEKQIAANPSLFVQLIAFGYKRNDDLEDPPEFFVDKSARQLMGTKAHNVLMRLKNTPAYDENGNLNKDVLLHWIEEVRRGCSKIARSETGDYYIGEILGRCQKGSDGIWPNQVVRDTLEEIMTERIFDGVTIALFNSRSAEFRPRPDSGEPERAISRTYAEWAHALRFSHPKTSELLNYMSERYNRDAEWQDTDGIVTKRLGKY